MSLTMQNYSTRAAFSLKMSLTKQSFGGRQLTVDHGNILSKRNEALYFTRVN